MYYAPAKNMSFYGEKPAPGPTVQDYLHRVGLRDLHGSEIGWMMRSFKRQLLGTYSKEKPNGTLKMIDTLLAPVPVETRMAHAGDEVFTLTFGGTNVSAAWVRINAEGDPEIIRDVQTGKDLTVKSELHQKTFGTPDELFDKILSAVESVASNRPIRRIGFVFTFPAKVERSALGIDVKSDIDQTKGFTFSGIDKGFVGEQLIDFMRRSGKYRMDSFESIVVLNDTPAVALAKDSRVGGIVGTGYNLCVSRGGTLYNLECGGFNDVIVPELARSIDTGPDKGLQLAEKQISGKYLGMQMERAIRDLHEQGTLQTSVIPRQKDVDFPAEMISYILDPSQTIPNFIPGHFLGGNILDEREVLLKIAQPLRDRSAHLVGIKLGTIVHTFPEEFPGEFVVAPMEGSVINYMPGYKDIVERVTQEYTGKQFDFHHVSNMEAKGAAIAAIGL